MPVVTGLRERFRQREKLGLGNRILSQIDERPSGLYLPGGLVRLRIEGERVKRVMWKIVRGLVWQSERRFLDEHDPNMLEIFEPSAEENPVIPRLWSAVKSQPSRGPYQAIFAHKHLRLADRKLELNSWAMLLWDSLLVHVATAGPLAADVGQPITKP